jgi:hypothetical protein
MLTEANTGTITISNIMWQELMMPSSCDGTPAPVKSFTITRREFEYLIREELEAISSVVVFAMGKWMSEQLGKADSVSEADDVAKGSRWRVDETVLVGGCSRIPAVKNSLRKAFSSLCSCSTLVNCDAKAATTVDAPSDWVADVLTLDVAASLRRCESTSLFCSNPQCNSMTRRPTGVFQEVENDRTQVTKAVPNSSTSSSAGIAIDSYTAGPEARQFCEAVNPMTVVAEGLAIYGAIVEGLDCDILRDCLMLDCIASTYGLITIEGDAISQHDDSSTPSRVFDPIVHKGTRLPLRASRKFFLESPSQRFVSLDIYEEKEIYALINKDNTESGSLNYEVTYSYDFVISVDVMVPAITDGKEAVKGSLLQREVEVIFIIDEDARNLKFDVRDVTRTDPNSVDGNNSKLLLVHTEKQSYASKMVLSVYLAVMVCLYAIVKLCIVEHSIVAH